MFVLKKVKDRKTSVILICLAILICSCMMLAFNSGTGVAYGFSDIAIKKDVSYSIKSNGGSFWLSFRGKGNGEERARFSFTLFDYLRSGAESSVSAFSETNDNYNNGTIENLIALNASQKNFLTSENNIYSIVLFKSANGMEFLYRKGVVSYLSGESSKFSENDVYGLYFTNVNAEFSFIVNYTFGDDFVLHYDSNVMVEKYENSISVDLDTENITIYTSEGILHPIYNEKISIIPFIVNTPVNDKIVIEFNGIMVNGENVDNSYIVNDAVKYFVYKLKDGDWVNYSTRKYEVDYDFSNVKKYNLFDITKKNHIEFDKLTTTYPLGNIGNSADNAFVFRLNAPTTNWNPANSTRIGLFTNNQNLWSNFGYSIAFYNGNVVIKSGEEVQLATGTCSSLTPGSSNDIEIGITKGYFEGVYRFNRIYAKVNDSVVAYYDEYNLRGTLGSAIVGPFLDFEDAFCSISDVRDYCVVKDIVKNDSISIAFDEYVEMGTNDRISIIEKEGILLTHLYIDGVDRIADVQQEGNYKFIDFIVVGDTEISYETVGNQKLNVECHVDSRIIASCKDKILRNSSLSVELNVKHGYFLSVLTVNGEDYISKVKIVNGCFVFNVPFVQEDLVIEASSIEKTFNVSFEEQENCDILINSYSVGSGKSLTFNIVPKNGYKIESISAEGYIISFNNNVYTIDNVYSDICIKTKISLVG